MREALIARAASHLSTLLREALHHTHKERAVLVYDTHSLLSEVLSEAYMRCLPHAKYLDFYALQPETILQEFSALESDDLVILVQSKNFRLDAFRMRVELFKRKIKVIEHPHLGRMSEEEVPYYIDAIEYDSAYYRRVGHALKSKLDRAPFGALESGGELLIYGGPFESAKLNIGDYSQMNNVGGQFPLGEVFTEAQDLKTLEGRVKIFSFGDTNYRLNYPQTPITLVIKEGQVVACENTTPEFEQILANIRADEGVVWVRELGLGLNRAFSKTRTVSDIGTYERMCGIHFSLGAKHGIYAKPGFKRNDGKYHVDVFADTQTFTLGDEVVYKEGAWLL